MIKFRDKYIHFYFLNMYTMYIYRHLKIYWIKKNTKWLLSLWDVLVICHDLLKIRTLNNTLHIKLLYYGSWCLWTLAKCRQTMDLAWTTMVPQLQDFNQWCVVDLFYLIGICIVAWIGDTLITPSTLSNPIMQSGNSSY